MELTSLKSITIIATLAAALVGGYLPLWYERQQQGPALINQGYQFAKGIFLGAALMHLLPAAEHQFALLYPNIHYPWIGLIVLVTIFLLHTIEHGSAALLGHFAKVSSRLSVYLLILTLSIHSVIEGAALGVGNQFAQLVVILVAVLAHKSADTFALVINMQRRGFRLPVIHLVMLVFACMTPLGVILGNLMSTEMNAGENNSLMLALINAITAGTFIYIACLEPEDMVDLKEAPQPGFSEIISLSLGIMLMAVVAIWI